LIFNVDAAGADQLNIHSIVFSDDSYYEPRQGFFHFQYGRKTLILRFLVPPPNDVL
jgi:hypothetical protein